VMQYVWLIIHQQLQGDVNFTMNLLRQRINIKQRPLIHVGEPRIFDIFL
jgi:hypothetical protein